MDCLISRGCVPADITFDTVKAALQGRPLPLKAAIDGQSLSHHIANGTYLNAFTKEHDGRMVIPKLSPLFLRVFSQDSTEPKIIANGLSKMLRVEENCHPLLYKDFHAWWEVIYRVVRQQEEPFVTIDSYYGIPQKQSLASFIPGQKNLVVKLSDPFPSDNLQDINNQEVSDLLSSVFLPAEGNLGFDIVVFEKKANGQGHIAINIECRYSQEGAGTMLYNHDVADKYRLVKRTLFRIVMWPNFITEFSMQRVNLAWHWLQIFTAFF